MILRAVRPESLESVLQHGAPGSRGPDTMDCSARFEVDLEGPQEPRWYTFDARHNTPRIGRILMARGRDATDVAITTNFGFTYLARVDVHTDAVA